MQWNKEEVNKISKGDIRTLARAISAVENESNGYFELLQELSINYAIPVIGITGPPGAGKSSLLNSMLSFLADTNKIAIVAVDPTSPFTQGSLLGDRLRMSDYFLHPNIYIRSVATRGSLGGLSSKIIEITDVLRSANFDYIFVETVGVGQSEVEIAWLADTTVLVLNPGAGDDVQALKSGILEIADIFIINKADKEHADVLQKNLLAMLHLRRANEWTPPVLKTIATENTGINDLINAINNHHHSVQKNRKSLLLFEKAMRLISHHKMKMVDKEKLQKELLENANSSEFHFYRFLNENYF